MLNHQLTLSLPNYRAPATCRMCGRILTNPESIQQGIGPICAGGHFISDPAAEDREFSDNFLTDPPLATGLKLERDEAGVWTNVVHHCVQHSPSGFEFGYGGSGPADLALNILESLLNLLDFTGPRMKCFKGDCFELAFMLHQQFKWQFISGADDDTFIAYDILSQWIKENGGF